MRRNFFLIGFVLLFQIVYSQKRLTPFTQIEKLSYTEFYQPVSIVKKGFKLNGFVEGECRGYLMDKKSTLVLIEHYKKGKLNGQSVQYYPNGRIYSVGLDEMGNFMSGTLYDTSGYFTYTNIFHKNEQVIHVSSNGLGYIHIDFSDSAFYLFDTIKNKFEEVK